MKDTAYIERTDEELVALCQSGDHAAFTVLMQRYKALVRYRVRMYYIAGGDEDDLLQEGMIALYKAVGDYCPDKQTSFRSFAELCVTRHLISTIKKAARTKHTPLNTFVPLDVTAVDEGSLPYATDLTPLELLLQRENNEQWLRDIHERLSPLECDVLHLYMEGYSYNEIAGALSRNPKTVDNALSRIKRKLRA